jgi:superfamily II DNA or RNA helicase
MDSEKIKEWVSNATNNSLQLRDYQIEAWRRLWQQREDGKWNRALIHLATGLGKTSVAAVDSLHYLKEENPNGRILFVSHMTDISEQARHTFLKVNPSFVTGKYHRNGNIDAQVTFTTFQALYRNLANIDPKHYTFIIWDEAHHIEADTFSEVREHFQPDFEVGLTATPERADGLDILTYFGKPLFVKSLAEGIAEGWLSAVDYHIVFDESVKKAMSKKFELSTLKEIRSLFGVRVRNEEIAKEVLQRRHDIGMDQAKTIVFCQNIDAAEEMASLLGGEVYHSDVDSEARLDILQRFKNGKLQVICTVDMFNEGIDIPDARLVVFLRSTSSRTIFEQQLGRGLRRHPGKDKVTVLDFVANVERINFVRDLGHTVSKGGHRGTGQGGGSGGGGGGTTTTTPFFATSSFEFEDQAIELLERYSVIKNGTYLKTEDVVAAFHKLGNIREVAESLHVTWNAIWKHLKKAGVDTSGHLKNSKLITTEQIIKKYAETKSINQVARLFSIDSGTVRNRLKKAGVDITPTNAKQFATPEMIEAFERTGSIRQAALIVGMDRSSFRHRLINSGIDTSRKFTPKVPEDKLRALYAEYSGDIFKIVEGFGGTGWVDVYKALDEYGYLKRDGVLTSAQAAAAYYKFGTSTKAGALMGVSSNMIIRKARGARYIPKYGRKRSKVAA